MHHLDVAALGFPHCDIGLVGDDHGKKARRAQALERFGHPRQDFQPVERSGRIRLAVAHDGGIDDAVAVEEHRAPPAFRRYHFVAVCCSAGCDTRQCQTTAWKASVCGVTRLASTVGTTMTQSPTARVYPPSRPTTPNTFRPRCFASLRAATMFGLTFFSRLPPPTENTNTASLADARLVRSQAANTVSQPSSLVRAVSSDTL